MTSPHTTEMPRPTYYVRHPDGSFSMALPQPTDDDIAAQASYTYAQCDREHGGDCCGDPNCWLAQALTQAAADAQITSLILDDPDGGRMVVSSAIEPQSDGAMRFTVTNPATGRRYGVYLGLTELRPDEAMRHAKEGAK